MLNYESIVWLFFRGIDSCILIALGAWLFIRKALPVIHSEIAQELDHEAALRSSLDELKLQGERLDAQLVDDAHDIERLEQKVRLWEQSIKRKQARDATEKEDILVRLHKQDVQRDHTVRHQKFYATALLEAVDTAERQLVQDRTADHAMVSRLVEFMASQKGST